MPYWTTELERDVVLRLASGDRWVLTSAEKSALFSGIEAEEFANKALAERDTRAAAAKLRDQRTHRAQRGQKHLMLSNAHAHVAALYSPRWDAYANCIDVLHDPPKALDDSEVITHTAFWQLAACLARRNATLANYLTDSVFPKHQTLIDNSLTNTLTHPPYQPIDTAHTRIVKQYVDDMTKHIQADTPYGDYTHSSTHAAKMVLVYAQEHAEELERIVRKCKALLRIRLQKGEEARDERYWLPISKPDAQVAASRARLSR